MHLVFRLLALFALLASFSAAQSSLVFNPPAGVKAQGNHVVLLSGDEEYRSEEALPMLAKILSQRHGFKCTVLFALDPDGTINPDNQHSLADSQALDSADAIIMALRFRNWTDDAMARFVAAGSERNEPTQAPALVPPQTGAYVVCDSGSDADWWRERLCAAGHIPVVPGRRARRVQLLYDEHLCRARHLVENCFARLKSARRLAIRYEQTVASYAAFVALA